MDFILMIEQRHYAQLKEELARLNPPTCLAEVPQVDDKSVDGEEDMESDDHVLEEEKPLKSSPLPSEEFAITYEEADEGEDDEEAEEEEEEDDDEEDEEEEDEEVSSQLINAGKEVDAEGDIENELDELKEMFSNVDSDVPLSWKEDLDDSEPELDNFVSQFTI